MHGSTVYATGPLKRARGIEERNQDQRTQYEKHVLLIKSLLHLKIYNLFSEIMIDRYSLKFLPQVM